MSKTSHIFVTLVLIMAHILTLNVKGLVSHQKQLSLYQIANQNKTEICFLQETNLQQHSPIVYPNKFVFYINPPTQASSGVAFAIEKNFHEKIQVIAHQILQPGYLQVLKIKINQQNYHLLNVYMPQAAPSALQVLQKIEIYIQQIEIESQVIIAGDWNVTTHDQDRRNCVETRTELANKLCLLIQQYQFVDVWRNFNPSKQQFSYRGLQNNNPMARLDRIYIRQRDLDQVKAVSIIPSCSDHSAVTISFSSPKTPFRPPYWKMDTSILQSNHYKQIVKDIISFYQEKSQKQNSSITILWDEFKEEIKLASQRFTKYLHLQAKEQLNILQSQINYIEDKQFLSKQDEQTLIQVQKEINQLYKKDSTNKLTFIQSQICNEANTQSKFFLRLANQAKDPATMDQLEINGQITCDKQKIFQHVQQTYQQSFSDQNNIQVEPSHILYQNLPLLSQANRDFCEKQITEEEILESINNAQINRAAGFDGIPIEFYKCFWQDLKSLLIKLINNFQQTSQLPKSMKKIIIKPIPKPGDRNQLKNWRPISLMNTDYKIISRIYSKKLSSVLGSLLSSDQSYCIPGRTIYDNLHLIRNVIKHSNKINAPLAILSIDQMEAFNKISHSYLQHLLKVQRFGPNFCNAIHSILSNTQAIIKLGPALLAPFQFKTGFRQGDPIAGPLYVLSIEPFLRYVDNNTNIRGYHLPMSTKSVKCTAFADDTNFFISQEDDFEKIEQAFTLYSHQSGARLNQTKSTGLFCGSWKNRTDRPLQFKYNNLGSKYLGVYLGNDKTYEDQNWNQLITKIQAILNRWSQYVKLTSFQGRRIVCNQLIGSLLIHTANILQPSRIVISQIQKTMNNFLWQGKHWLHQNYIYAPQNLGGIELINLQAKINSLRVTLANKIQDNLNSPQPTFLFHSYNLSLYGGISPPLVFCHEKQEIDLVNLDPFYQSLIIAWHNIAPKPVTQKIPINLLRMLPLYGSKLNEDINFQIIPEWKQIGHTTLRKLLNEDGTWNTIQLSQHSLSIQRRISFNYNQMKIYFNKKINNEETPPNNRIQYNFKSPFEDKFIPFPSTKKIIYNACLQPFILKPQINGKPTLLNEKINWKSLYHFPLDRKDSDVSWRLLYNALATPRKFYQWKIIEDNNCPWCPNQDGNVTHMIFHCKAAKPLWAYASQKIQAINNRTSLLNLKQALIGFTPSTPEARLSNLILSLVKSTIYRTYMNLIKLPSPPVPAYLQIFKKRIQYRLKLEKFHAKLTNNEDNFSRNFLIKNALLPLLS